MGINFDEIKNKAQDALKEHGEKIEQGLDKASGFAKSKLGPEKGGKVDDFTGKAKDFLHKNSGGEAEDGQAGSGGQPGQQPSPPPAQ
jgi:hypothetical protein